MGAATWPIDVAMSLGNYFSTQASLIAENERLRAQLLANVQDAQRYQELQSEAAEMRRMIGATDKLTFAVVAVGLTAVAALAGYLPARRASRLDPVLALRTE